VVQEVAVRRFSCSVFLSRQDIDPLNRRPSVIARGTWTSM
jgi:hypothetical protein